jgi:hypothetical protein
MVVNEDLIQVLSQDTVLLEMRNTAISDNKTLRDALQAFRQPLPSGWEAELVSERNSSSADAYFRVTAPNRKVGRLAVEAKRRLEPRGVIDLVARRWMPGKDMPLIVAPYLSPAVRGRLREASLGFLHLT